MDETPDDRELQFLDDLAAIYYRPARKHIVARDWFEATKALMERVRELDVALQSLTPGGSEYVGDPERCVQHVRGLKERYREATLTILRKARADEASGEIPF